MANDIEASLRRIQGLAGKVETNHAQVDSMMRLQIADGLGAQQFGQMGNGNVPDPTSRAAFTTKRVMNAEGRDTEVIIWRDHRPEDDRADYIAAIEKAELLLEQADTIRQRYMSANNNIRDRLDPTEFCVLHFSLHLYEGHRRVKGPMCKICAGFYDEHKREPTATEADYYHRHGRWPHKLVDPKQRRAV